MLVCLHVACGAVLRVTPALFRTTSGNSAVEARHPHVLLIFQSSLNLSLAIPLLNTLALVELFLSAH
jgi:hypothetical protein